MTKLSVVLVTHNSARELPSCLEALVMAGVPTGIEVLVWDNASTDGTIDLSLPEGCRLIQNSENVGFAAGCNRAVEESLGRWVLLLNPDTRVAPGFLRRALACIESTSEYHIVTPRVFNPDGSIQVTRSPYPSLVEELFLALHLQWGPPRPNADRYVSGACVLLSRQVWTDLGGFDERYFLYGEDADLCRRASDLGYLFLEEPSLQLVHHGSQGWRSKTSTTMRLLISGRITFIARYDGHLNARVALAAYRLGALVRAILLACRGRANDVSIWLAVARLSWSQAIWFGSVDAARPLRICAWPGLRQTDRNPYTVALYRSMEASGAEISDLRQAGRVLSGFDVLHVHWPEATMNVPSTIGAVLRGGHVLLAATWARARRAQVVWTVHNLEPHDRLHPFLTRWLMALWCRLVTAVILNSESSAETVARRFPALRGNAVHVSSLPSYLGLHDASEPRCKTRARLGVPEDTSLLLFVGQIRRYKHVEALIAAFTDFASISDSSVQLLVAGPCPESQYADELTSLAARGRSITLRLEFLGDEELGNLLSAADLLVLPLDRALNSSTVVLGLSYGTPMLAPDTATNRELRERYPASSLQLYSPPLEAADLASALDRAPVGLPAEMPTFQSIAASQLAFLATLVGVSS